MKKAVTINGVLEVYEDSDRSDAAMQGELHTGKNVCVETNIDGLPAIVGDRDTLSLDCHTMFAFFGRTLAKGHYPVTVTFAPR